MEYLLNLWHMYPVAIDLLLYLFVFSAAARVAFSRVYPGHEGKILSIAVGLFLAAGLAMAQRRFGFSTESMGPVAVFILCGVVFIASYQFIKRSELPKPMAILLSSLLALALARAAMPNVVEHFVRYNPLTILLLLGGLVYWAWHSSDRFADRIDGRRPASILAREQLIPREELLHREESAVKNDLRRGNRKDRKQERRAGADTERALTQVEKKGVTPKDRDEVMRRLSLAQQRIQQVRGRTQKLLQMDSALEHFDYKWFQRSLSVNLGPLTPEQQKLVQDTLLEERRRLKTEEELAQLERRVDSLAAKMGQELDRAQEAVQQGNSSGAAGWMAQALQTEKALEQAENLVIQWENRLLALVKRQEAEMKRQ